MSYIIVIVGVLLINFVFGTIYIAVQTGIKYGSSLQGAARARYLLSLSKEDLEKEPFSDRVYVWYAKQFGNVPSIPPKEEREKPEDLPTFKEYKIWQAERPDLKTWQEYKEWKSSTEEERTNADGGDA